MFRIFARIFLVITILSLVVAIQTNRKKKMLQESRAAEAKIQAEMEALSDKEPTRISLPCGGPTEKTVAPDEGVLMRCEMHDACCESSSMYQEPTKLKGFPEFADEEYLLAQIIYCEAGSEGADEMRWVGSVLINRARTTYAYFEAYKTIIDVLYQKNGKEYSPITIRKVENGIVPSEEALAVAKGLIDGTLYCEPIYTLYQCSTNPTWDVEVLRVSEGGICYAMPSDYFQKISEEELHSFN